MIEDPREVAKRHVIACIEQIMPIGVFDSLVRSIPDQPTQFRDSHPLRMLQESVRACHTGPELRQFFESRAHDWQRLVIAWAMQRLLYEIARADSTQQYYYYCIGRSLPMIPRLTAPVLCMTGLLCLSGQWYGNPANEDEHIVESVPPEKYFDVGGEGQQHAMPAQ